MSRRDRRRRPSIDDLLRGTLPSRATADELVDLIERINPTERGLSPRLETQRYRLKAQLQSQLLRRHFHSVAIVIEDHGILALALRVSGRSAAHVPLEELDDDVRAVVQRAIDTGALEDANAPLAAGGRGRAAGSVGATDSAGESEPPGDTRARLEDMLEVWDHAPILALASTTPHVRLAQAVVHAREGNIEEACKLVADVSGARASEVWSYVGENALANADIDRMVEARDALARLDLGGAVLERLEAELEVRRRDDLARRDNELRAALVTTASAAEREELAPAHLRRNAASHLARKVLDEVRVRRVLARREQLLERAAVSDAMEAARLLRMARAEGAENLDARIQRLEAEAETERVASEARTLETACAGSDRAGALATWLGASPRLDHGSPFRQTSNRRPSSRRPPSRGGASAMSRAPASRACSPATSSSEARSRLRARLSPAPGRSGSSSRRNTDWSGASTSSNGSPERTSSNRTRFSLPRSATTRCRPNRRYRWFCRRAESRDEERSLCSGRSSHGMRPRGASSSSPNIRPPWSS